jgi:hypothetical protein
MRFVRIFSMSLTSMQAAEEFSDVIPIFSKAWNMAWIDLRDRFNEPGWDNSTRSHVMQMQAVNHARDLFNGSPDVAYFTFNNRHVFQVRDNGLFKLKQLDENHCSSNYSTLAARQFENQGQISGLEDCQRFTVGFIPNPDWTDYIGIYLTFPTKLGAKPNWVLDITNGVGVDIESLQQEFDERISQPERRFKPIQQPGKRKNAADI